ncbi:MULTISPECIES: glycosyltransferase family 2 protein [Bacteria]|uniref:glycosyltransferase family 2 protein n=1 Tax=Bacteria TaxID=2 RepID=UPI003F404AD5
MKKSILIITYGREEELYQTLYDIAKYQENDLEVLILDNNETNFRKDIIENIFKNTYIELKYYNDGKNYGVALGRNYIIQKSSGDILITLDDDIEIKDINLLVKKVENYFSIYSEVGCLAFNIKNYFTKKALRHEIPHGNKKLDFSKNMETYYFIGAGHAIRKIVYDKCGLYPDDLGKYGGEEEDLSYRILEYYKILYCYDIEIYHKNSPNGRMAKIEEDYCRYRNKLIVRNRYLNKKNILINWIIWSIYYFFIKKGKIKDILKVKKEINSMEMLSDERKGNILKKLKALNARIIY